MMCTHSFNRLHTHTSIVVTNTSIPSRTHTHKRHCNDRLRWNRTLADFGWLCRKPAIQYLLCTHKFCKLNFQGSTVWLKWCVHFLPTVRLLDTHKHSLPPHTTRPSLPPLLLARLVFMDFFFRSTVVFFLPTDSFLLRLNFFPSF